jgi:subtilisin family serine protease
VIFNSQDSINETAIRAVGGTITGGESVDILPAVFAKIDESAISRLETHPDVRRVEYDRAVDVPPIDSDRRAAVSTSQATRVEEGSDVVPWGIDRINARKATEQVDATAESNVTVAVLDTGIDYDHEDLTGSVTWGVDVIGETEYGVEEADDVDGHGTHVAGTIAARENAVGVVGVSTDVQLYSIQVLGPDGGRLSDVVKGIDQALKGPDGVAGTSDDADVISMSLGGESGTVALREAIERATNQSVPVVVAAGNEGNGDSETDDVLYPARYDETIAVAATDLDDDVPRFSSEGPSIGVGAPGVDTVSTYPDDQYARLSGTSMATGHVSGTVALMIAVDLRDGQQDLEPHDILAQLEVTAKDIERPGSDDFSGAGLVNATRAVSLAATQPELVIDDREVLTGETVEAYVVQSRTNQRIPATVSIAETDYSVNETTSARHRFNSTGTYTVTATVVTESGYEYVTSETVSVAIGNILNNGQPARDLDTDSRYEDINGDGDLNVVDVQALFANLDDAVIKNNPEAFDFNGDGQVDVVDIQRLFDEL